ncbi:MAG: hypothetical protein ACWA41_01825 [Putridiphycobacter sp.]
MGQDNERDYVLGICDLVENSDFLTDNLSIDSTASLPIGIVKIIGGTKYIIAIDSAEFTPTGAYFNAYMALDFPGSDERIAFAAKHIKFNPKGVIGGEQAKLALVSEHYINLGPKNKLHLPSDGSNYIEWDCNGFKAVNLHGDFILDTAKLVPITPVGGDSTVRADFEVYSTDVHDIITNVNITPFRVKGLDGFEFTINEAYVDLSDLRNPTGLNFPENYPIDPSEDLVLWRGFFLKGFSVKLPDKLSKKDGFRPSIYGQNMIIDDAGISGKFGATNVFTTEDGKVASWSFSVTDLNVDLVASNLTGGSLSGEIGVPALDNAELDYQAIINYNPTTKKTDYVFSSGFSEDVTHSMSALKSTLTIKKSSSLNMTLDNEGHFVPTLKLNGDLTANYENINLDQLAFENVTFVTEAPYLTQGYFSLTSSPGQDSTNTSNTPAQQKIAKYPVSLQSLTIGVLDEKVALGVDAGINLGSGVNQMSVEGSCFMKMNVEKNPATNQENWAFDSFQLNTISVDLNTSAFGFFGAINFRNNDPVYGKGFGGEFNLRLNFIDDNAPEIYMACAFGKVNDYKYWMVDSKVSGINIPIGPASIVSLAGGVAYHMRGEKTAAELIESASEGGSVPAGTSMNTYIPDDSYGFTFKAGVGINGKTEETFNGDVCFQVTLNANGGLNDIQMNGNGYMMCKRSERATSTNYAKGDISIIYDNQQKILDLNASIDVTFNNVLTGNAWTKLYISPDLWFFWLGKPDNRAYVNIINVANADAYFMAGMNLPPMPPPPPQVATAASNLSSQRDNTKLSGGNGIAAGASLYVGFNSDNFWLDEKRYITGSGGAGIGFDMTMLKYPETAHCSGSSGEFGMNYWYLQGQIYAYLGFDLAYIKLKDNGEIKKEYTIAQMNTSVLLQGKLPKPTYVNGVASLNVVLLNIINVNIQKSVEFGTNCVVVN